MTGLGVSWVSNDRLLSFLGLCKRAGYLISGAETVTKAINDDKALLMLYASDASANSLKNVLKTAKVNDVPALMLDRSKEELSFALGKHCGIVGITDRGFADKIQSMIDESK